MCEGFEGLKGAWGLGFNGLRPRGFTVRFGVLGLEM